MLNDKLIRELRPESKPYRAKDGGGLFLDVRPTGGKYWRIIYRDPAGKVQTKTLGQYPTVTLTAARAELSNLRLVLERGDDPKSAADPSMTFGQLAREWFSVKRTGWKDGYAARVWARIEADALPDLEHRPIASITAADLLAVLRKMEGRGVLDVSKRLRQQFEDMFTLAIVTGRATSNPATGLQRALAASPRVKHRAALPAARLPDLFKLMHGDPDMSAATRLGLTLILHTAVRTGEARFGQWTEVDRQQRVWRIPAARMKMHRPHVVPLTDASLRVLDRLKELAADSPWLLPGDRPGRPISENTLLYSIYRLGLKGIATVHGFRGTFSTAAHESGKFKSEWIEMQLAHVKGDKVAAAYNHSEYLKQRGELMQWWSERLDAYEAEGKASCRAIFPTCLNKSATD